MDLRTNDRILETISFELQQIREFLVSCIVEVLKDKIHEEIWGKRPANGNTAILILPEREM